MFFFQNLFGDADASSKDEGFDNVQVKDASPSPSKGSNLHVANDNVDADIESEARSKGGKGNIIDAKTPLGAIFRFCLRPWVFILLIAGLLISVVSTAVYVSRASYVQRQNAFPKGDKGGKGGGQSGDGQGGGGGGKGKGKGGNSLPQLLYDTLECGQTFEEELTLFQDLKCTEPPEDVECAIKLSGKNAKLDCSKYRINQDTTTDCSTDTTALPTLWNYGICLSDGASAKNCNVQGFGQLGEDGAGLFIENGGEVEDFEVMSNSNFGILVRDTIGSTTKISNTFVYDNASTGIFVDVNGNVDSESEIEFENVRSNNNKGRGMEIKGSRVNLKKKDIETSSNTLAGLYVEAVGSGMTMDLQGFTSRNNKGNGMVLEGNGDGSALLDVLMKGVLNIYMNSFWGFGTLGTNVVVENGGSLNACLNGNGDGNDDDINDEQLKDFYDGATDSIFSGKGTYTCDKKGSSGFKPNCVSCPTEDEEG